MVLPAPSRPDHLLIPVVLNLLVTGTVCFIRTKDSGLKTGAYLLHVALLLFMRLQPRASQDYRRSTATATRAGLLKRFRSFADCRSKFEILTHFQKNPAGSGYSKGPRKLPDPERPPQPGLSLFFLFCELSLSLRAFCCISILLRVHHILANPIFEPEKCKAYIAYTCKMCILNNKVRALQTDNSIAIFF